MTDDVERHLKVYEGRSVFVRPDGTEEEFQEGPQSEAARARAQNLQASVADFLRERVHEATSEIPPGRDLAERHRELVDGLVGGVTSEVGRGLVGLAVAQTAAKCIEPVQSTRLHKGSRRSGFGWTEGVGLRQIAAIVALVLREFDLLRLNASGPMMTRTLAENYPYTSVYKAAIRGPKAEWLELVDAMEADDLDPEAVLEYLLLRLSQESALFSATADELVNAANAYIGEEEPTFIEVRNLILGHVSDSTHSARLFEVAMHSLMQAIEDTGGLDGQLRPLVQMRTADLKAGKVADIEVSNFGDLDIIVEAWDAKYGRPYLVDEVDELGTKLQEHLNLARVGFVVDGQPILDEDVMSGLAAIEELYGIEAMILSFDDWVELVINDLERDELAVPWLDAYVESLALRRRDRAPIDEPTVRWIESLIPRL